MFTARRSVSRPALHSLRLWLLALLAGLGLFAAATVQADEATPAAKPRVSLQTNLGTIVVELYPTKAPKTVANFLQYVKDGFYNGTIFHRVIRNFMIQGGGFTTDFQRKPTRAPIVNEADNGLGNARGTIAMARTFEPHSATSQFFINVVDNPRLDFSSATPRGWGYCVFGKVVKGMDVVDKIRALPTGARGPFSSDVPLETVVIEKASLLPADTGDAASSQDTKPAASVVPATNAQANPSKPASGQ